MGKSSSRPPDYTGAAIAEGEALRENVEAQTWANRPERANPWGNENWTTEAAWDETTGQFINKWKQTTTLADPLQNALEGQMGLMEGRSQLGNSMMGDIKQDYATGMNWDQFGDMQSYDRPGELNAEGLPVRQDMVANPETKAGTMQSVLDFSEAPAANAGDLQNKITNNSQAGKQNYMKNTGFSDPGLSGQNFATQTGFDDPGLEGQRLQDNLDYSDADAVDGPQFTRQAAEDSLYERATSRLDPQFADQKESLEITLANKGLTSGDAAYEKEMDRFNRDKNDAYSAAQNEASMAGGREAERMFGMQSDQRNRQTGEVDRQGEYRNAALSGQFGQDAQRQAQMQNISQSQAQFGNEARGQQFATDAQRQSQGQQIAQNQAQFGNDARGQQWNQDNQRSQQLWDRNAQQMQAKNQSLMDQYGMDASQRERFTAEQGMMGDFWNQAQSGQYAMNQGADAANFDRSMRAAQFSNQARDQGFNERMSQQQFNTGQDRDYANYMNQLRQQNVNETTAQRGQRLSEVNALISGQQVNAPQFNSFNQASLVQPPSLLQAAGMQGQQQAADASADASSLGSMMGGAASIGMMMSDRRLKKNIKRIGMFMGLPLYSFDYLWNVSGVGFMADEVPEQYRIRVGEFDMVDYGGILA